MTFEYKNLQALINQYDLEGFIKTGAPDDEYMIQAETLYNALMALDKDERAVETIAALIHTIWQNSFDLSAKDLQKRRAAFIALAEEILKLADTVGFEPTIER